MNRLPHAATSILCFFLALVASTYTFAGWHIATSKSGNSMPDEPFFQTGSSHHMDYKRSSSSFPYKSSSLDHPPSTYAISVSGSLKENVERIMDRYHWKVIWKSPYDYNFDGRVTGASLPSVISKLFKPFPLQAQLFMSNRTMIVIPRNTHEA